MIAVAASGAFAAATGGIAHADTGADGTAAGSAGVGGGNTAEAPVGVPVNLCANGVRAVGLLSPTLGGVACTNAAPAETPPTLPPPPPPSPTPRVMPPPPPPTVPPTTPTSRPTPTPSASTPPPSAAPVPQAARLAETGADTSVLAVAGVAFLLGGTILYRRARSERA